MEGSCREYEQRGRLATFSVKIQYAENATWQGMILWAEGNRKLHFRSALEMLKLMDSALDKTAESMGE